MSLYTEPGLKLNFVDPEGRCAELLEDIWYELGHEGSNRWLIVPAGFMSDGASVPRPLWSFMPPWGSKATKAALIHDYLLITRPPGYEGRKACDDEFYIALIAIGVDRTTAYSAWAGVRANSLTKGLPWRSGTRASSLMAPTRIARSSPSSPA